VILSLAYLIGAGVIASWSPALNGWDLSVCYVAGTTARRGASPYQHAELVATRRALPPPVATKASLPFGYPPAAIPACVFLSFLPWQAANYLWKLLNLAFLVGCVLLTLRLNPDLRLAPDARYLTWSVVFGLSPTVSVLLVGQSSLFVLCAALLGIALSEQRRPGAAGVSLAFSLIKPHLIFPLLALLLVRRRYAVVLVAAVATAVLTLLGLYLGHEGLGGFLQGLQGYNSLNDPDNPRLVGIQSLANRVLGWPQYTGQAAALALGLVFLAFALTREGVRSGRAPIGQGLPAVLVVSTLAFGAHSYDLVFLIPLWVWAVGWVEEDLRFLPIVLLCSLLVLPLRAVTFAYDLLLSDRLGDSVFRVAVEPYRSWILLLLFAAVMYVIARPIPRADPRATGRGLAGGLSHRS
jgi:hypothetical protein